MKGIYNPISILKVKKFRKENKDIGKYPYSRFRSIYADGQGKRKDNKCRKTNN